jgi:UDP-N-acetylmuramoyl-tripeptide--D-alanyl-D-alanine ligase
LEFFGDLQGVIEEEGCLAEALPPDGKFFLNADTPGAAQIARRSAAPVVRVGLASECLWRARVVQMDDAGTEFEAETEAPGFSRRFRMPLLGHHQVINATLALAVAAELGVAAEEAARGLAECRPAKLRLQLWKLGQVQFLDDSYNANADSMRAALDTLRAFPCRGRRIAVLGDMGELGPHAPAAHEEIGAYAAARGVDYLLVVGRMASMTARGARAAGLNAIEEIGDVDLAAVRLREHLRAQDVVLLKASRAAALDRIGERLRAGGPIGVDDDVGQRLNSLGKR